VKSHPGVCKRRGLCGKTRYSVPATAAKMIYQTLAGSSPWAADPTFETHYTIAQLAEKWGYGRETVRLLVRDEPGVCKHKGAQGTRRYSVAESVARRIHTKLLNPAA
jgi:hypothetical protein